VRFTLSYFRGTKIVCIQECYEGDYVAAKNNDLPRFLSPSAKPRMHFYAYKVSTTFGSLVQKFPTVGAVGPGVEVHRLLLTASVSLSSRVVLLLQH
jgi:hypothetical protein